MADLLATTNREENFLQTYFNGLAQSSFDKCKDAVDRERDTNKNQNGIWPYLMGTLSQLATTEKSYMALLFLVPKSFLRKENSLKSAYDTLRMECRRTEEFSKVTQLDLLVVHLLGQLAQFASARLELMEFYEKLSAFGTSKQNNLEELLPQIHKLSQTNDAKFHHPLMTPLKSSFSHECEILAHLLDANAEMASWNYLPALLKINETQAKLDTWAKVFQLKETRRLGLFKNPTSSQLFQWLMKFKCLSVSKFTLYFYEVLSKYSTPQDLKALCAKQSLDYVNLIQAFQRKADARAVSLILDVNGLDSFRGPGYVHPSKPVDTPKGLDSYPCIFTSPDKSIREIPYWPSVIMLLADRIQELSNYEKLVYVFDHRVQRTYFLQRVEPRLTLVLIFESKRLEKESYIISFMNEITQQLRGTRIFNCLKGTGSS